MTDKSDLEKDEQAKHQAFQLQLDILKFELDIINNAIARFDEHARATRNWAIVTWTGSIAFAIGIDELRQYVILTAILPILFWLVDARWTTVLRAFLFRQNRISDYLNSSDLVESFKQNQLINFRLLDPKGRQYKNSEAYKKKVNLLRSSIRYGEVSYFYLGLVIISVGLGLYYLFPP